MSRKDYQMIAKWLWCLHDLIDEQKWRVHCTLVADDLARDNARFNRSKFLEACGIGA